jgi:hypothetical protein
LGIRGKGLELLSEHKAANAHRHSARRDTSNRFSASADSRTDSRAASAASRTPDAKKGGLPLVDTDTDRRDRRIRLVSRAEAKKTRKGKKQEKPVLLKWSQVNK